MDNATLVQNFIEEIWNNQAFDKLDSFLHPDYKDHTLLPMLPPGREGTQQWIMATGASFHHHTVIESLVSEAGQCMVRIKTRLKHIGTWRGIGATGVECVAMGFRQFILKDGKIIAHWGLIDGLAIETRLQQALQG